MKLPPTYRLRVLAAVLAALALTGVPVIHLHAQEATETGAATDVESAPAAPAVPGAPEPDAAAPAPDVEPSPTAPTANTPATPEPAVEAPAPTEGPETPPRPAEIVRLRELVTIMNSSHLRANESTPEMVTIMGNAIVDGVVNGSCVTVMGNVTVNGQVRGELVCVGGRITLGPGAEVLGEMVSVGGGMDIHPTARARGEKVAVTIPGISGFGTWFAEWAQDGLGQARILPHNHRWAWGAAGFVLLMNLVFAAMFRGAVTASARAIETRPVFAFVNGALVMLLAPVLFVLLAASVVGIPLVPIAVAGIFLCWFLGTIGIYCFCGQQLGLMDRPVLAALAGNVIFLLLYAVPVVGFAVWSVTGVMGLGAAITAMGNRRRENREARLAARRPAEPAPHAPATPAFTPQAQTTPTQPVTMPPPAPSAATQPRTAEGAVGAASTTSHGAAALFIEPSAATAEAAPTPGAGNPGMAVPAGTPTDTGPIPPPAPFAVPVPPLPTEAVSERATFWPRLFAFVLDLLVVTVAVNVLGLGSFPTWVLAMIGYHVFFWGWRGTTPAGIVGNLQIVRDDGSPMDYKVAAVRALSGVFSLVPAGLGFIWVAFDRESQAWHDKLAGTSVVAVRKARPLV